MPRIVWQRRPRQHPPEMPSAQAGAARDVAGVVDLQLLTRFGGGLWTESEEISEDGRGDAVDQSRQRAAARRVDRDAEALQSRSKVSGRSQVSSVARIAKFESWK